MNLGISTTNFTVATLYCDLYFSKFLLMAFFLPLKSQTFVISHIITPFSHGSNLPLIQNNPEHDIVHELEPKKMGI